MNGNSLMQNSRRFDLSDKLIHWVRPLDLDSEDASIDFDTDEWGAGNIVEDTKISPFFLLRRIVRMRQLQSTYSYRGKNPTIYGKYPAVCFTEMPLAAFIETSHKRQSNGQKISPYCLIFPKDQLFSDGARPVIYGTSVNVDANCDQAGIRTLNPPVFGEDELYRYVAFTSNSGIDWTHEREWRWANRNYVVSPKELQMQAWGRGEEADKLDSKVQQWTSDYNLNGRHDANGLNLDSFRGVALLVKTARQERLLTHDILRLIDTGKIDKDLFSHIIKAPAIKEIVDLHDPDRVRQVFESNTLCLESFFDRDEALEQRVKDSLERIDCRLKGLVAQGVEENGEEGDSWVWIIDNLHPVCRCMVHLNLLRFSKNSGRYLLHFSAFNLLESLGAKECMAIKASEMLSEVFPDLKTTYFSVMTDGKVQYLYTGAKRCNEIWQNYAHSQEDY